MEGRLKKIIRNRITGHITFLFFLIVILFIAVWTRVFIGSMRDCARGEAFFHDGQYIKAITFFDRSMHWYAPLNPYIERSADYLWEISNRAEETNDSRLSMIALETIRNSFYSVRSFYSPGIQWIEQCKKRMNTISLNQRVSLPQEDNENVVKNISHENTKYNDPDILWAVLLEIGLFGWIASVLGFVLLFLGATDRSDRFIHSFYFWILLGVFSYSLWIIGMINA